MRSAQRRRSLILLIQVLTALLYLETRQRVREGLHGVPDLHHWDLTGSNEGVRVHEVVGLDWRMFPNCGPACESPRGISESRTLQTSTFYRLTANNGAGI